MKTDLPPQKFFDTRTTAHVLNVSESSLKRFRANKTGPKFYIFGSTVRYSIDDLKDYIESSQVRTKRH